MNAISRNSDFRTLRLGMSSAALKFAKSETGFCLLCTRGFIAPFREALMANSSPLLAPLVRVFVYMVLLPGALTGCYITIEDITSSQGQFSEKFDFIPGSRENPLKGTGHKMYRAFYGKEELLDACKLLVDTIGKEHIITKTFVWLRYNSYLSAPDGIIFWASKIPHVKSNMFIFTILHTSYLSTAEIGAYDNANELAKSAQEPYFRMHGRLTGDSEIYMQRFSLSKQWAMSSKRLVWTLTSIRHNKPSLFYPTSKN